MLFHISKVAIVTSFILWFVLTWPTVLGTFVLLRVSLMLPFFRFSAPAEVPKATGGEAMKRSKKGAKRSFRAGNITASINFCEGPDFHHSVLAEPVNASLGSRLF